MHLNANQAMLTPALVDATNTYVARHNLKVPVVITAVLEPVDGVATELPVMVRVDSRVQHPSPSMPAAPDSASSAMAPGSPDTPAPLKADIPTHVLAHPPTSL